jgi:DNA-binding GntR family transcriptional regulator
MAGRTRSIDRPPIARRSLSDSVYDEVLAMLMDRQFEAGDTLSIDGLARQLGVSPTPVREALARLEGPGLVRRTALKGYRVAPILTPQELHDLMEARLVLEPVLASRACERSTPEFLHNLGDLMSAQHRAGRGPHFEDYQDFLRTDEAFHSAISQQSGNQFLDSAYTALGGQVQRFRLFAGQGVIDAEQSVAEHQVIFDAITSGSPEAAADAMRSHLTQVAARATEELAELVESER